MQPDFERNGSKTRIYIFDSPRKEDWLAEIQKAIGLRGILYEGEYYVTKSQMAKFLEVSERAITTCTQSNIGEVSKNGYAVLTRNSLKNFRLCIAEQDVQEANFPNKTPKIGIYSFHAFLNVSMLLTRIAEIDSLYFGE